MSSQEHKANLKFLRVELTKRGVQVVGVRRNARTGVYSATSCNFVQGGHIFDWLPGSATVRVLKEVGGKYVPVSSMVF